MIEVGKKYRLDKELKLFSTQIETWGSPLLIRAYDEKDAEELTRILFKVPSDVSITATTEEEEEIVEWQS